VFRERTLSAMAQLERANAQHTSERAELTAAIEEAENRARTEAGRRAEADRETARLANVLRETREALGGVCGRSMMRARGGVCFVLLC
jgi:sRNA-binding protein